MAGTANAFGLKTLVSSGAASVAFSPDQKLIYVAQTNGFLAVIDTATGNQLASWKVGLSLGALSVSPDGSYLLVVERSTASPVSSRFYKVDTATGGSTLFERAGSNYLDVEIVNGSTAILTGGQQQVTKFDLLTNSYSTVANGVYYSNNSVMVEDQNLTLLAEQGISNGPLVIYDDRTGTIVARGDNYQVYSSSTGGTTGFNFGHQAISEAGNLVAQFIYHGTVNLFDLNLRFIRGFTIAGPVDGLAFDATGKFLIARTEQGQLNKYDVATGAVVDSIAVGSTQWHNNPGSGDQIVQSSDGKLILVKDNNTGKLQLLDLRIRDELFEGTAGADGMAGGKGDDVYLINNSGDSITELVYDGTDTAIASIDYTLPAHVERLTLTGPAQLGVGNDLGNQIFGTGGANRLEGMGGDDYIDAGAGSDSVDGGAGNDTLVGGLDDDQLFGGTGADELHGQDGNDILDGGSGRDRMFGGLGIDTLVGGADDDSLYGQDGDDELHGQDGNDFLDGGSGRDRMFGGLGIDTLLGGGEDDALYGQDSDDELHGQDGNDFLDGGSGRDRMFGGAGIDTLLGGTEDDALQGNEGDDELHGQDGNDLLDGGSDRDTLFGGLGIDTLLGGTQDDALHGQEGDDELHGQDGNDFLNGGSGRDSLFGGTGVDTLVGGAEDDRLYGQNDNDELHGEDGNDHLEGGLGADTLFGGIGNDLLIGDIGADRLYGGLGADALVGGADDDGLYGEGGDDELHGLDGNDFLDGGSGRDRVFGGLGIDTLLGGAEDDALHGQEGDDELHGQEGHDFLDGGSGRDRLNGGLGIDTLLGGADDDALSGQDGDDELHGQDGNDFLDGGTGRDLLLGGLGIDTLVGGADDDRLYAQEGNDELHGEDGNDHLEGGLGADALFGGLGSDVLIGGAGADRLIGGAGADLFIIDGLSESAADVDQLLDFNAAEGDRIDLSRIDANALAAGVQQFTFIGTGAFTGQAGQLRYQVQDGQALVLGDVNGDGVADLTFQVSAASLSASDFIGVAAPAANASGSAQAMSILPPEALQPDPMLPILDGGLYPLPDQVSVTDWMI